MKTVYYVTSTELYHHGIKGQKWGVRKYQNEDGSLTPAGKKRYGADSEGNTYKKSFVTRRFEKVSARNKEYASDMDQLKGGVKDKKGRQLLTAKDVDDMQNDYSENSKKYQERAEKSFKQDIAVQRSNERAKTLKSNYSTGSKIATNIFLGPFANTSVSRLQSAGMTRGQAIATTAVTGPLGGMLVSNIMARKESDQ